MVRMLAGFDRECYREKKKKKKMNDSGEHFVRLFSVPVVQLGVIVLEDPFSLFFTSMCCVQL